MKLNRSVVFTLSVLACGLATALPLGAAHYKLFVLTGQSNSLGTTNGGEVDPSPGSDPADAHVKFFWHNRADATTSIGDSGGVFTTLQEQQGGYYPGSATHWGPEINFARTLYRAGVRDFGVVKASRGGGGNTFWSEGSADDHMYQHVVDTVTYAASDLTGGGHTFEIVGLLYLQGESDSAAEAAIAGTRLDELVLNLRADLPNASAMHCVAGGIAAATANDDTVRTNQAAIAASRSYIDYFENLDLQGNLPDGLHFDKIAKLTIGERYALAFFDAGVVSRWYGKLTFLGDSITQGGNGNPSYRYQVFTRLAEAGVPINATTGYEFTGSVTGAYQTNAGSTPDVSGQTFANVHDGHWGWRTFWTNARLPLPAGRYDVNNLGQGTILNWIGTGPSPGTFETEDAPTTKTYTGTTHTPDTAVIMLGINDLGDDPLSANQVVADLGTLIDQLRVSNPDVSIFLNRLLYTNQTQAMKDGVDAVNAQLQGLADTKNAASTTSAVWVADASTGFDPISQTYDNIHPNADGEAYVGDRIAAALGLLETPTVAASPLPPRVEVDSSGFDTLLEGNDIYDGASYVNGWAEQPPLTEGVVLDSETTPALTDLQVQAVGSGGAWIEGTNAGWAAGRAGDWTLEMRMKFDANPNGFIVWLGTGGDRILIEIHGDRTQDLGGETFNVTHNNLDGQFHVFRVAHESVAGVYHVWRDGERLTPVAGAGYDGAADGRLILGDYTSGAFGNGFDVTIDHVRLDQNGAYLPPGADADGDGLPDAWEYFHFGTIDGAVASEDPDGDGRNNGQEQDDGTDPNDPGSVANVLKVFVLTGQSNSLGTLDLTDLSMQRRVAGTHAAEEPMAVPFFWDNRADGTAFGDTALGDSGGAWVDLGPQTGGYYADNDDHWGPEVGFARMLWNSGYRDFAIVKASRGGGGNSFWVKGGADDHMYQHVVATVQDAVASLPAGYDDYAIEALLYLQGESNDSTEADEADVRFSSLLTDLQADLANAADLKGIFGEIGGGSTPDRDLTRTRQEGLAAADPDVGYADAAGTSEHDGLHYDADSILLLGERMAAEAIAMGCPGSPPLPAWSDLYAWFVSDNGVMPGSGGALDRWGNLSDGSAAHDLTRTVGGRPTRMQVTSGSGEVRRVVGFNGITDLWASSGEFGPLDAARTVAVLCRVTSPSDGFLFDGSTFTGRTRAQVRGGDWQVGVSTSSWDVAEPVTVPRTEDVWQRHVFVYTPNGGGTDVEHWIDGVQVTTPVDAEDIGLRGLILGSNGGSPFRQLAVDVAEVAIYEDALGAAAIGELDSLWQARWGAITGPPFGLAVSQTAGEIPRFGWHALLEVRADVPTWGTTIDSLTVDLAPGTKDLVETVRLIGTGTDSAFHAGGTVLGEVANPGSDTIQFLPSAALVEGSNYLWIAIEPKRWAPLGSVLDGEVTELVFSGSDAGTVMPLDGDPVGELVLGLVPLFSDVRRSGDFGINTYRIPGIACDDNGVLHAVFDHRWNGGSDLPADVDVGYARSVDGGASWSGYQPILDYDSSVPGSSGNGVGDPCILWDPATDTLWAAALWSFGNNGYNGSGAGTDPADTGQYVLTKSEDGGLTWSAPINVTVDVKDDPNWRLIFQGPGHGLVMRDGTLVFPSQYRDATGVVRSCSVYSTDNGVTWDFGSGVPTSSPQTNENTVCELDDGRLLFSMRTPSGSNGQRAWIHYSPGGAEPMRDGSWSSLYRLPSVPDPVCQGSVIQWTSTVDGAPRELVLFGNPASSSSRVDYTLRVSADGGDSWPVSRLLYDGSSAYSALCILPDNSIGVFFEKDNYTRVTFARVEEDWLWNPDADGDGDGMPDSWEEIYGTDPGVADAGGDLDGDGSLNGEEYAAGTDPDSADSLLQTTDVYESAGGWTVAWSAVPGRHYEVFLSDDLESWEYAGEVVADEATESLELPMDRPRRYAQVRTSR